MRAGFYALLSLVSSAIADEIVVTTSSGLSFVERVIGDGDLPEHGSIIAVHYVGTLEDGTQFDSSVDRGWPFEFTLGEGYVIAGWDEGISTMRLGGSRKLVIPSDLAYGEDGVGPIPGNATLLFEVELVGILGDDDDGGLWAGSYSFEYEYETGSLAIGSEILPIWTCARWSLATSINAAIAVADPYTAFEEGINMGDATISNVEDMEGRVALIGRGDTSFDAKAVAARDAGAVAVIIVNNDKQNAHQVFPPGVAGSPMAEPYETGSSVDIPVLMISYNEGANLASGASVILTITSGAWTPGIPFNSCAASERGPCGVKLGSRRCHDRRRRRRRRRR